LIKVLIVDDSVLIRRVLSTALSRAHDIEVIGTAEDPYAAREQIAALRPDVLTLDIEMPRMDGLTFLGKLMEHYPLPVVVLSSITPKGSATAIRALELGALDVVCKPQSPDALPKVARILIDRIRLASQARCVPEVRQTAASPPKALPETGAAAKVLAIGASTGGTRAIERILPRLPANTPGTLIVQHMPANFTMAFAKRLNGLCPMKVREARTDDQLERGVALIAPGGKHMILRRTGLDYTVEVKDGPKVHHQRPSVDVLFHSVARHAGADAVGVLLTGMGEDGAAGMGAMREAGAHTLAQDEESCVVFGMPKAAIELGAAVEVVSLHGMANAVLSSLVAPGKAEKERLQG
jgi:two-component system chemotaxis response regulator CheB